MVCFLNGMIQANLTYRIVTLTRAVASCGLLLLQSYGFGGFDSYPHVLSWKSEHASKCSLGCNQSC